MKDIESTGSLVPPTAAEDPLLPKLVVNVAGKERALHLQTFGNPVNPPLFVLPGGPGADFRLLLPLKALADSFYVVMWDPRGAGLSERVPKEELSFDSFMEEVTAVKRAISPANRISLLGHSYGGLFATRYTGENPEAVSRLILIEPGQMNPADKTGYNGGAISFIDGQGFFWTNEVLTSSDHNAADYKAIDLLPKSSRNFTCDRSIVHNYPMWRFGSYQYYILTKNARHLTAADKWSNNIEGFSGKITVIAGTCGAASENFQINHVLPYLPRAQLKVIGGAGHLSLFTDHSTQLVQQVRNALR
ncbi:MAG TPA: alpha/beta fold hydrolase [Chitinophagaceae bacterium]